MSGSSGIPPQIDLRRQFVDRESFPCWCRQRKFFCLSVLGKIPGRFWTLQPIFGRVLGVQEADGILMLGLVPRANRLYTEGGVFHLTHRCHNRAFLLRFCRDRDAYRLKMREKLKRFAVSML